jgi:PAS domain S-box-containing protein
MVYQMERNQAGVIRFVYVSAGVEAIHGITAETVQRDAAALFNQVLEEDRALLFARNDEAFRTLGPFNLEIRIRKSSGEIRWIFITSIPTRLFDGGVSWDGLELDITERKQVEEALRESEFLLAEAQRIAKVGSWCWDLNTNQVHWSAQSSRIFGLPLEMAASYELFLKVVHPAEVERVKRAVECSLQSRQPLDLKCRLQTPAGEVRAVHLLGRVQCDANGQLTGFYGTIQDFTEHEQTNDLLRFNAVLLDNLSEGIFLLGLGDLRIQWANPIFEKMFGYNPGEMVGMKVDDLNAPTDKTPAEIRRGIMDTLLDSGYWHGEVENLRKDGTRFWCHANVSVFEHPQLGKVVLSAHTDITEKKQAREALRESEQRFHSYFELPLIGIAITSLKKGWIEVNDCLCDLLAYSRPELMAKTWAELTHPDDLEADFNQFNRVLAGEIEGYFMDKRFIRKDGQIVWASLAVRCVRKADRTVDYFAAVLQNITARKRAEEKLKESEHRFASIFRTGLVAVGINRADNGMFVEANDAFLRLVGYARSEVLGHSSAELGFWAIPKDRERFMGILQDRGQAHQMEVRIKRKSGELAEVEMSAEFIELNGQPHLISMLLDITERKRAHKEKEQLEAQKQILQKSESLNRMAGAIAHHFNNQLGAAMLSLDLAAGNNSPSPIVSEALANATESVHEAAKISTLMLTFLGQTPSVQEPLDLVQTCQASLGRRKLFSKEIQFHAVWPDSGPVIKSNASQIQQLLDILLTNACEACGGQGGVVQLAIHTAAREDFPAGHRFPIDSQPQNSAYACLEVRDDGCGIPEQNFPKLFDPFFSTKFVGRGLGLPVVLGIVRSHNGFITVESQSGRGSTFRVYFPLSEVVISPKPTLPAPKFKAGKGRTILLAEDDSGLRSVAARALKMLGFEVCAAEDGGEALELFKQHQDEIICVLCDLTMPRMDGWEVIHALRRLDPEVPVILASGYNESQALAGHHAEPPQAFLSKPYDLEELRAVVTRVLQRQT